MSKGTEVTKPRPDTCRAFFSQDVATASSDESDVDDDVAFIDATHFCDSPPPSVRRHNTSSNAGDVIKPETKGSPLRPNDVFVTSPVSQLEFHDQSYFYDDGAFVEGLAESREVRSGSPKLRQTDQKSTDQVDILASVSGDSGYSESSADNASAEKSDAGREDSVTSDRLLQRRRFHHGAFVRYRYPARYHRKSDTSSPSVRKITRYEPPTCLRPRMRYENEPIAQRRRLAAPKGDQRKSRWPPKLPQYPPRRCHVSVECDIIRLVDKLDIGIQSTPTVHELSIQCTPCTRDTYTQCTPSRQRNVAAQTVRKKHESRGTQHVPKTRSRMVDTDFTVICFPNDPTTTQVCSRCRREEDASNVNYWISNDVTS